MVVHARTLEFYRQFGFGDQVVAAGIKAERIHLRRGGDGGEVMSVSFADLGEGISPYPFALAYPQDDHERFLVDKLAEAGCTVEWSTKLTGFTQVDNGPRAVLAKSDGSSETCEAAYLCGCDGAHSRVRNVLGLGFPGGTYDQLFYVADALIAGGFQRDLVVNLGEHILTLVLPVRSRGVQRLIGLVPPELSHRTDLTFDDIRNEVERLADIEVTGVNWFSTYRVHHRVAEHFRAGRAFILGDAAHVHSPAGGQGMNTGIGDAINLGWKLADVIAGRAPPALLDSFEPERIAFARTLVATTDRAFTPLVAEGLLGEATRRFVAPLVLTIATRFAMGRHAMFRTLSQTQLHYADSPLSEGKAGHVHGGDRLPWTGAAGEDNFAPLRSLDWQVHVYGEVDGALASACTRFGLPLHYFTWSEAAAAAGLARDAAYLVRPDGYVALASDGADAVAKLTAFIDRLDLRFMKAWPKPSPEREEAAGA
jgi:2-polyprenyl-6-methoxyphenol hydroxylase-like FAD-dependent oxidoreductase